MATVSNLFVDQGSYFSTFINVVAADGTPLNLSTYTVAGQMRKSPASSVGYDIPCSIIDPELGRIKIRLDAESTENIPSGRYLYDIEITDDTGEKLRIIEGVLNLIPQITRT